MSLIEGRADPEDRARDAAAPSPADRSGRRLGPQRRPSVTASMTSTDADYTRRLQHLSGRRWKRFVPNPYRWNVRRLATGRVLDVGCGIGRCLDFVRPRGVGVDPNEIGDRRVPGERSPRHSYPRSSPTAYPRTAGQRVRHVAVLARARASRRAHRRRVDPLLSAVPGRRRPGRADHAAGTWSAIGFDPCAVDGRRRADGPWPTSVGW